jgi:glutamate--cysteine ligase
MEGCEHGPRLHRAELLDYFVQAGVAREGWQVGMEVERLGRDAATGAAVPYDAAAGPSIRAVLEAYRAARGGEPALEGERLVGLDADWGELSLEPGGQVEWSSRPRSTLAALERDLDAHRATLRDVGGALGVRWLDVAVDPLLPVSAMRWVPKARYAIMRDYLGARGRLAHRMMTQTASVQCAFDYADPEDWKRKFVAAARLTPIAVALFANSSEVDGGPSGYRSYRQAIWRETDPDRSGIPALVFDPGFDVERWLDWVIDVPAIFRHRAGGLVAAGGVPFRELLHRGGCDAVRSEDWETHASTIFTEVRSYTYIEVRSADLQPDGRAFAVTAFWTGVLYHAGALDAALALGRTWPTAADWSAALDSAARDGLAAQVGRRSMRDLVREALSIATQGLAGGAACATRGAAEAGVLEGFVPPRP